MEAWWYTTPLASQLIRQQVGGYFFDVGLLGPCEKACRGGRGCCEACLGGRGRCQACLGGRACLHILGSYINIFFSFTLWIIVTRWESLLIIKSLSFWDKEFNQNWFYFFGWQDIWTCTQYSLPKRFFFGLTQENNYYYFLYR